MYTSRGGLQRGQEYCVLLWEFSYGFGAPNRLDSIDPSLKSICKSDNGPVLQIIQEFEWFAFGEPVPAVGLLTTFLNRATSCAVGKDQDCVFFTILLFSSTAQHYFDSLSHVLLLRSCLPSTKHDGVMRR